MIADVILNNGHRHLSQCQHIVGAWECRLNLFIQIWAENGVSRLGLETSMEQGSSQPSYYSWISSSHSSSTGFS